MKIDRQRRGTAARAYGGGTLVHVPLHRDTGMGRYTGTRTITRGHRHGEVHWYTYHYNGARAWGRYTGTRTITMGHGHGGGTLVRVPLQRGTGVRAWGRYTGTRTITQGYGGTGMGEVHWYTHLYTGLTSMGEVHWYTYHYTGARAWGEVHWYTYHYTGARA